MIHPKVLLREAVYYAPRGEARLQLLGSVIGQNFLSHEDKLIGLIGDSGSGKSLLIRGMFPGLNLTNDDEGVYRRPLPLVEDYERGKFYEYIYHVDIRFELAFYPIYLIAEAILKALEEDKKIVCEHFELIYPYIKRNADLLIGIGEEVIVSRPNIFGPLPEDIVKIVFTSLKYRLQAHTAEDLTGMVLEDHGYFRYIEGHSDVRHGFVIRLREKIKIDPSEIEEEVKKYIESGIEVSYVDRQHIKIGDRIISCTGPRLHVKNTKEIREFCLYPDLIFDEEEGDYLLVGFVDIEEYDKIVNKLKEREGRYDKD
ncbi:MAG: alanine-tRNA synthetase second additional domain-containing protein [Dictyoglomus thermophilum]|uniref:Alanine-tRNA synthetase second additional domain-containing protein n=1 Tax=Dictyoglomus thermophilum TaxID=14 RepID=A0A7C3PSH7_DICTH|nr:alanine-tRNA synthetase second additional domain-containing protein [Dictyoglomus thermophilum]MCX7719691.1 alanine-tRNA synthetase second additional domain-containing protein [Dictyoglomus thermophilum]TYT21126.1 alanine-tRNA synthetase second additional domain-containing protein [Dictyoglomus thermophilum]